MKILSWTTLRLGTRRLRPHASDGVLVQRMRRGAELLRALPDRELLRKSEALRESVAGGASCRSPDVLAEAFALVQEAARRTLGITYYDEQLLAGLYLARGCVAEMQTGEGKTFAAVLPAFVHALTGRGVHVVTANRYLAGRDQQWLQPVYACLGVSVGLIGQQESLREKSGCVRLRCDLRARLRIRL